MQKKLFRTGRGGIGLSLLLLFGGCAEQSQPKLQLDAAGMPAAKKPDSEHAAQQAVVAYMTSAWLKKPGTPTYTFQPLTTGAVTLGFGLQESGWFMCGTVTQPGDTGPRNFFAHFDRQQPDIVDGAVDFNPGRGLVSHWCADVYRTRL